RASSYIRGEIAVYEALFDSGLRGTIPALILNPPAWRILIAIQNLGDLEYLSLGINEVLFAYHLAPLNGGEGGLPIVEELPKSDWKGPVFNKKGQERYAFMLFPGSSYRYFIGDMSGGVTNDPFTAYQEAAKVISRRTSGDVVMITGSRRSTVVKLDPSPSLPGKRPKSGGVTTRLAQQLADMARYAGSLAVALSNLNLNVFPQDGTALPIGDPSEVVQVLHGGLLRTVSQLYTLEERLSGEKDQRAALELEIRDIKDKVKDLEKVAE
ncbi:hypothetical protein HID58_079885, partial [Brassica napus]